VGQNAFLLVIYLIIAIIARILACITRADFNVKIGLAGVGFAVTAFAFSLGSSVKTDSEIRKLRK
jgi:membrane associated rhomboid family serine protease